MIDAKRLLDQLISSGVAGGVAGGLAGGALAQSLSGKKVKKLAGKTLQVGGLALIGGLAYKAWQNYQRGQGHAADDAGQTPILERRKFLPGSSHTEETSALTLLLARAVISAAKADGRIDTEESQAILSQINGAGLSDEDKAFLLTEYNRPLDLKDLTGSVDTPEHAAEVYAASVLILEPPSPAERTYLDSLARELRLEAGLVEEIHAMARDSRKAA